tara:strand:+ start:2601 stop:2951 length:351 start_codon:yes stop_codon:yes gene_type:complete
MIEKRQEDWENKKSDKGRIVRPEERRTRRRQPVLWKSVINVGTYSFDCVVFDVSLGGAKLKFDLPLKPGTLANLVIKDQWSLPATVVWQDEDRMGVKFDYDESRVRVMFGPLAERL